jgi:hypothetical protein
VTTHSISWFNSAAAAIRLALSAPEDILMKGRCLAAVPMAVLAASLSTISAGAQSAAAKAPLPRTDWGHPDLQGFWTNATFTPLQRPASLAGKEFFTSEEAAELQRALTADGVDPLAPNALAALIEGKKVEELSQQDEIHYDNAIWLNDSRRKGLSTLRTSLIVDPPDGRIPPLTPEAQQRATVRAAALKGRAFEGPESRPLAERCIIWPHEGPPLTPPPYNNLYQIFQTPGYVVILQEIIHNARIIPLDGRPAVSPNIRQLSGNSRGRWEGSTLVVETSNFTGRTRFQGSTETLRVVERFTRIEGDSIDYQFTVEDPATWTRPWSAAIPMLKTEGPLFEYACHEGNYDLANILGVARALEREAAR